VCIITTDGRYLVGYLSAQDNMTNLVRFPANVDSLTARLTTRPHAQVLRNAVERVIRSPDEGEPSAEVPLGVYIIRGENVCVVGLVDDVLDTSIDWTEVKGAVIGTTKH
jgi:U6 snRNA-associated Sm-like protein LSm8